jgi:phage tail tape-measure protein
MTDVQQAYVDWITSPEKSGTKTEWAKEHGVSVSTLYEWQRTEWYQSALDTRMRELNLSMDKVHEVIAALQKKAAQGDSGAAKLYLQFLERVQPMKAAVSAGDLAGLDTMDLYAMLDGPID